MKKCIGIDIAKKNFVAAVRKKNDVVYTKSFSNNDKGALRFIKWATKFPAEQYHFCMEATGIYGDKLALFLHEKGHIVSIVNPAKIKYFMKSQLSRNKTDPIDARYILQYCELFNLDIWHPKPLEIQALQQLVKRLDTLIKAELEEQNRLENASEIIKDPIIAHIGYLKEQVKNIEKKIKNHIGQCSHLKEKAALLISIIGIGQKTTNKILAFLGNIENFDNAKQAGAFVGLNPHQFQSGTSLRYGKLSKTGDPKLRKMFYMPALTAVRHNPILKAFYERLIAKGKLKKVAICAVMRKLVHIVYGVLKSKKPFDLKLV